MFFVYHAVWRDLTDHFDSVRCVLEEGPRCFAIWFDDTEGGSTMRRSSVSVIGVVFMIIALGGLAHGQVLNIAIPQDPDSFDPVKTVAAATSEVAFNIYEGLVKATPEGEVVGALSSHWTVNDSNTIYTFYLRDGAVFHDGTQVTADDVVHALNRARDPEVAVRAGELSMIRDVRSIEKVWRSNSMSPMVPLSTLSEVYASIYPAHAADLARNPVGYRSLLFAGMVAQPRARTPAF